MVRYTYKKFERKFDNFFKKKSRLLGEIYLSENQYKALLEITRNNLLSRIRNNSFSTPDIVISVALVHIGINDYIEGNYWDKFCESLNLKLSANQQRAIGQLFLATLDKYGLFKYINPNSKRNDYVINILIHGIVPNYYIYDFFEFIYTFYDVNLNRSITPNLSNDLKYLTEFIADSLNSEKDEISVKVSGYSSMYRLRRSTKLYISMLNKKSRLLIRRLVKLIDAKYWGGELPKKPRNRITRQFLIWTNKSPRFKTDIQLAATGRKRGEKQFTSPYFTIDFENRMAKLVIPPEKFKKNEFNGEIKVEIRVNDNIIKKCILNVYSIIGGYKTEEKEILMPIENIFDGFDISLISGLTKRFNIPKCNYILFNERSESTSIHAGTMYILTKPNTIVESDDLIEKKEYENFTFYYLELEYDSVLFIDGVPLSPSGRIREGIQRKGLIPGIKVIFQEENIPVYKTHPNIIFIINDRNIDGIGIVVNGKRYRLSDIANQVNLKQFELMDGSGRWVLHLNLSTILAQKTTIVEFGIDIPATFGLKKIEKYIILPELEYEFFDAPYIFTDKAVIEVNDLSYIKAINMDKLEKGHVYGLNLTPEKTYATFLINLCDKKYKLLIEVPYLRWKFDNRMWHITYEENLWYKNVGDELFIDFPDVEKLSININNDPDTYQEGQYIDGLYKFNFRRYLDYFLENGTKFQVNLNFNNNNIILMTVLSKCMVKSVNLSYDPIRKILNGSFDIIGKSKCVADIIYKYTGEMVAENIYISNGHLSLEGNFKNGLHTVVIYSIEEDEFGFDVHKRQIYKKDIDTTNPYDLSDKVIKLKWLRIRIFKEKLFKEYIIDNIKMGEHFGIYYGNIYILNEGEKVLWEDSPVMISFIDKKSFSRANFKMKCDDEWIVLLYDTYKKELVLEEDHLLPKKIAYRRYEFLSEEDTEFAVEIKRRGS